MLLAAFALAGLIVLITLGLWQLERLEWKNALIAKIEARAKSDAIGLNQALGNWRHAGDIEYYRVKVAGRFEHGKERHFYTLHNGQQGWRVITPLVTDQDFKVLVDRGFVPELMKDAQTRLPGQVGGRVEVIGLARRPEGQGWFVPDNDIPRNRWFWRDLQGMARSLLSVETGAEVYVAPFFIEMEAMPVPGDWPKGGVTRLKLPNRHLEYALTWFGLAAALLAVFAFFVRSRLRGE